MKEVYTPYYPVPGLRVRVTPTTQSSLSLGERAILWVKEKAGRERPFECLRRMHLLYTAGETGEGRKKMRKVRMEGERNKWGWRSQI